MTRFTIALLLVVWANAGLGAERMASQNPSVKVEQITHGPKKHFFGYIGHALTIPWDADDRYIVALRTDFYKRMPRRGEAAEIVLIDTQDGYRITPLTHTFAWNLQQGAMLYWNPNAPRTQFFFNDLDPETGAVFTALYDIRKGRRVREYRFGESSIANAGVSPTGGFFVGVNYRRISRARKVISYPGAGERDARGQGNPADDGVFKVDIATGEKTLLASYAHLAKILAIAKRDYPIYAHHALVSRSGRHIFFLIRGRNNAWRNGYWGKHAFHPNAGLIIRADGTGLRRQSFDGHPEWAENDRLVVPGQTGFDLVDVASQKSVGRIGTEGVFRNTWEDNALSPNAVWHVASWNPTNSTCIYTFFSRRSLFHVDSPPIQTMRRGSRHGTAVRIDPAPRWNRSGNAILAPGVAGDGTRQLFVISLKLRPEPEPVALLEVAARSAAD